MAGGIGRFASRKLKKDANGMIGVVGTTGTNDNNNSTLSNANDSNSNSNESSNDSNGTNQNDESITPTPNATTTTATTADTTPFETINDEHDETNSRPPTSGSNTFHSFNDFHMTDLNFQNEFDCNDVNGGGFLLDDHHQQHHHDGTNNNDNGATSTTTTTHTLMDQDHGAGGSCDNDGKNGSHDDDLFNGMVNFETFHDLESTFYVDSGNDGGNIENESSKIVGEGKQERQQQMQQQQQEAESSTTISPTPAIDSTSIVGTTEKDTTTTIMAATVEKDNDNSKNEGSNDHQVVLEHLKVSNNILADNTSEVDATTMEQPPNEESTQGVHGSSNECDISPNEERTSSPPPEASNVNNTLDEQESTIHSTSQQQSVPKAPNNTTFSSIISRFRKKSIEKIPAPSENDMKTSLEQVNGRNNVATNLSIENNDHQAICTSKNHSGDQEKVEMKDQGSEKLSSISATQLESNVQNTTTVLNEMKGKSSPTEGELNGIKVGANVTVPPVPNNDDEGCDEPTTSQMNPGSHSVVQENQNQIIVVNEQNIQFEAADPAEKLSPTLLDSKRNEQDNIQNDIAVIKATKSTIDNPKDDKPVASLKMPTTVDAGKKNVPDDTVRCFDKIESVDAIRNRNTVSGDENNSYSDKGPKRNDSAHFVKTSIDLDTCKLSPFQVRKDHASTTTNIGGDVTKCKSNAMSHRRDEGEVQNDDRDMGDLGNGKGTKNHELARTYHQSELTNESHMRNQNSFTPLMSKEGQTKKKLDFVSNANPKKRSGPFPARKSDEKRPKNAHMSVRKMDAATTNTESMEHVSFETQESLFNPVTPSPSVLKKKSIDSKMSLTCKHLTPPTKSTRKTPIGRNDVYCGDRSDVIDSIQNKSNQQKMMVTPGPVLQQTQRITPSPEGEFRRRPNSYSYKQLEDLNFDDVLAKFQKDLVDSTDIRKKCDNQLVDLRVQLCVSENVTLRLHSCFNDLLDDIETALKTE